jgi:putative ABC transport system substrate-binding protein
MRRRTVLSLLGGAAIMPRVVLAQPSGSRMRVIGVILSGAGSDPEMQARVQSLREGLQALGWVENRNYRFEMRWPSNDPVLIKSQSRELAALAPDVIVTGSALGIISLRENTQTVPIIFANVADPVGGGLIASLRGAKGNVTGFTAFEYTTATKWLELLKEIAPGISRVAFVFGGPELGPTGEGFFRTVTSAAPTFGVEITPIRAGKTSEGLDAAIDAFAAKPGGGLLAAADAGATNNRGAIIAAVARHRLPAVYPFRYYAADGGLAVYGVNLNDQYRRAAEYVDRIFHGAKPADLPIQAPDKFELIVNLKTAKALSIAVPPLLLARADEVIE